MDDDRVSSTPHRDRASLAAYHELRQRFRARTASVGVADFGARQLVVVTNAGLEVDEPPAFVFFPLDARMMLTEALGRGDALVLDGDEYVARYPTVGPLVRRPEVSCVVALGFAVDGAVGSVSLGLAEPCSPAILEELAAAVRQLGPAFAAAFAADESRRSIREFQQSLVPGGRSSSPSVFTAVRYLPAADDERVGGDWVEVVDLDDRRVAFIVGDIDGTGRQATLAMGQTAAAARALLVASGQPDRALEQLDRFAAVCPGARGASVAIGVMDVTTGEVVVSAASIPPLLLVTGGVAVPVPVPVDPPIGLASCGRRSASFELPRRGSILAFTDGLLGRLGASSTDAEQRIRDIAGRFAGWPPEMLTEALLRSSPDDAAVDDTAMACVRRLDDPMAVFSSTFPAERGQLTELRRALSRWVIGQPRRIDDHALLLATSEAVSNSIEHAYRGAALGTVTVEAVVEDDAVRVLVLDHGRWGTQIRDTVRGRGLGVVEALSSHVEVSATDRGTAVWFTVPLG